MSTNPFGTIDDTVIKGLQDLKGNTTYSFKIEPYVNEANILYNPIVVTDKEGHIDRYFIKKFTAFSSKKLGPDYDGKVEKYDVDGTFLSDILFTNGEADTPPCRRCIPSDDDDNSGNGSSSGSGSQDSNNGGTWTSGGGNDNTGGNSGDYNPGGSYDGHTGGGDGGGNTSDEGCTTMIVDTIEIYNDAGVLVDVAVVIASVCSDDVNNNQRTFEDDDDTLPCCDDSAVVVGNLELWSSIDDCINSGNPDDQTTIDTTLFSSLGLSGSEWGEISNFLQDEDCSDEAQMLIINVITVLSINPDANPIFGADCRSFEYAQPPGALQKGCAVTDFNHTFYTGGFRPDGGYYYGEIDVPVSIVYFTMPSWMTNGQAANLTAQAVTAAIKITDIYYIGNPDASEFDVADIFRDAISAELALIGGSISTSVEPFPIPSPAPYIASVLGISNPFDCD